VCAKPMPAQSRTDAMALRYAQARAGFLPRSAFHNIEVEDHVTVTWNGRENGATGSFISSTAPETARRKPALSRRHARHLVMEKKRLQFQRESGRTEHDPVQQERPRVSESRKSKTERCVRQCRRSAHALMTQIVAPSWRPRSSRPAKRHHSVDWNWRTNVMVIIDRRTNERANCRERGGVGKKLKPVESRGSKSTVTKRPRWPRMIRELLRK